MKNIIPLVIFTALITSVSAQDTGVLPNSSFEVASEGRPKGWRMFTTPPEVNGDSFIVTQDEGTLTRTGFSAIQFHFPDGADLAQAVWMADPIYAGAVVEPGNYTCSFWIRAEDMQEHFHTWVSIVGYSAENARIDEIARSNYLQDKELGHGEWTQVRFDFDIPEDGSIARIAPSVILKTHPDHSVNPVPPGTRVIIDDLEIIKN